MKRRLALLSIAASVLLSSAPAMAGNWINVSIGSNGLSITASSPTPPPPPAGGWAPGAPAPPPAGRVSPGAPPPPPPQRPAPPKKDKHHHHHDPHHSAPVPAHKHK